MHKKIIARLEGENHAVIFNQDNPDFPIISSLYATPNINAENSFSFNPERKIEEDEWFFVTPNAEQKTEVIKPYLDAIDGSEQANNISADNYPAIKAICLVEKTDISEKIILTRIFRRFYTLSKKFLKWNDGPKLVEQSNSVDFSGIVDAFWDGNKLYFKSYAKIKPIFPGLESFYRTATETEANYFLEKDFFECPEPSKIKIGERNLRKIASILEAIDWDNIAKRQEYIKYAGKHPRANVEITSDGKLKIDSNKDVSNVLNILEERIYTTPITGEEREANSVTKLE